MGKTAFSGPAWGAQHTLLSVGPVSASTGSSAVFAGTVVPRGEDWFITGLSLYRNSTGSTDLTISIQDDSTTIGSIAVLGSSIVVGNSTVFAADSGEYAGIRVLTGSTITLSHSSHAGPNANLVVAVFGYPRWIPSSRVE